MNIELAVFLIFVFVSFINQGVQMYIHFEAYPLLASVGKAELPAYIEQYEKRLSIPLLLPYGFTLVTNLIMFFTYPAKLSLIIIGAAFVVNIAVAAVTMLIATPVYNHVKQESDAKGAAMAHLMQINLGRLFLTSVSSGLVLVMLSTLLSA